MLIVIALLLGGLLAAGACWVAYRVAFNVGFWLS
jgi:hypothetical protein